MAKKNWYVLAILAITLPLMGASCVETEKLRASLVATCDNLASFFAHYDAVAETGAVSARTMARVQLARTQTDRVCASPQTATSISVLAAASSTYLAVRQALKEGGNSAAMSAWEADVKNLHEKWRQ